MSFGPIRKLNILYFAGYTHMQCLRYHDFLQLSKNRVSVQAFCRYMNCWCVVDSSVAGGADRAARDGGAGQWLPRPIHARVPRWRLLLHLTVRYGFSSHYVCFSSWMNWTINFRGLHSFWHQRLFLSYWVKHSILQLLMTHRLPHKVMRYSTK